MFLTYIFADRRDAAELERIGVIRDPGGKTVEFWCADEPFDDPTMTAILWEAQLCQRTFDEGMLRLAMAYAEPYTLKFKEGLTLENLRKVVQRRFGIQPLKQRLTHKGTILSRGQLSDQGVAKGSIIIVSERASIL